MDYEIRFAASELPAALLEDGGLADLAETVQQAVTAAASDPASALRQVVGNVDLAKSEGAAVQDPDPTTPPTATALPSVAPTTTAPTPAPTSAPTQRPTPSPSPSPTPAPTPVLEASH